MFLLFPQNVTNVNEQMVTEYYITVMEKSWKIFWQCLSEPLVKCYVINIIGTDHGRSATSVVENILFSKTLHHHAFDKLLREES